MAKWLAVDPGETVSIHDGKPELVDRGSSSKYFISKNNSWGEDVEPEVAKLLFEELPDPGTCRKIDTSTKIKLL